jgi:hypothetical protein
MAAVTATVALYRALVKGSWHERKWESEQASVAGQAGEPAG